jgi:hypothetical protein
VFLDQLAVVLFQIFLKLCDGLDLGAHSLLIQRLAVFEMSQMPPDIDNFNVSLRQLPKLVLLEVIGVFRRFRN